MKSEIYKSSYAQEIDQEVPEFGGYLTHELKYPQPRLPRPDLFNEQVEPGLRQSAVDRSLYFAYQIGTLPHVHFPNAEHFQHIPFTHETWSKYGNPESEYSRVKFMLENYSSRFFPDSFGTVCQQVLSSSNILAEWSNQIPELNYLSSQVYHQVLTKMVDQKVHDDLQYSNGQQGAFQADPVFYDTSYEVGLWENQIWETALWQIADELGDSNYKNLPSFLHLYNRIKDSVTPLKATLPDQVANFRKLFSHPLIQEVFENQDLYRRKILLTQLALEASFLSLPQIEKIACVIYSHHHELPYIYVDITKLPRGEFANPQRVIEILEMLIDDAQAHQHPVVTPITVSNIQRPDQNQPELFIIDGNNRATAMLLVKFFDFVGFEINNYETDQENLRRFIGLYDLDIEWERDLAVALKALPHTFRMKLLSQSLLISKLANSQAPALLVQEPNFHTVGVAQSQDEEIVLLQPLHQAIYNHKAHSIAIPSKQQSHGRAAGNDILMSLKNGRQL